MISLSTAIRPALPPPSCGTCWQDMVMINPPSSSSSDGPCADLPVRGCRALRAGSKLTSAPISRAQALVYQKTRPCSSMGEAGVTWSASQELGAPASELRASALRLPSEAPERQLPFGAPNAAEHKVFSCCLLFPTPPLFLPDPSYCSCLRVILLVRKVLAFS